MKELSVSDNPVEPDTYNALRNLREVTNLNIGRTGLKGREKEMVDVLMNLPALGRLYAGYNEITDVREFSRLRQVGILDMERNSISDLSPLQRIIK